MDKPKLDPHYQILTRLQAYQKSRLHLSLQGAVFFRLGHILYVEFEGSYTIYLN